MIFQKQEKRFFLLTMIALFLIGLLYAFFSTRALNFLPLDGDFQTYNGVRRLLSGQVPFVDFYYYLGIGPLFITSCIPFLMHNNLFFSIFGSHLMAVFCLFSEMSFLAYLVFHHVKKALKFALLIVVLLYLLPSCSSLMRDIVDFFFNSNYYSPGNSLRVFRFFLPYFLAFWMGLFIWLHRKGFFKDPHEHKMILFLSILAGFSLIWSNDLGIPCFFVLGMIFFIQRSRFSWKFLGESLFFIGVSLFVFFILISLVTHGHFLNWVHFNQAIAFDQPWYYVNLFYHEKIDSFLLQLFYFPLGLGLIFFIGALFLGLYYKRKKQISFYQQDRFYLFFLIFFGLFLGTLVYSFVSLGTVFFQVTTPVTILVILFVWKKYGQKLKFDSKKWTLKRPSENIVIIGVCFLSLLAMLKIHVDQKKLVIHNPHWIYSEPLGGYIRTEWHHNLEQLASLLKGKTFYSTYSSALENYTQTFNPVGIDYIIHILGEDNRQRLLFLEKKQKWDYVVTLSPRVFTFIDQQDLPKDVYFPPANTQFESQMFWEPWVIRGNWFFYQRLFTDYDYVKDFGFLSLWKKKKENQLASEELPVNPHVFGAQIVRLADNKVKINIQNREKKSTRKAVLANIQLEYSVEGKGLIAYTRYLKGIYAQDNQLALEAIMAARHDIIDPEYITDPDYELLNIWPFWGLPIKKGVVKKNIPIFIDSIGKGQILFKLAPWFKLHIHTITVKQIFKSSLRTGCNFTDKEIYQGIF